MGRGGLSQDHVDSVEKHRHGCDLGSGDACCELGYQTEIGRGAPNFAQS
jgi:hypothetical protein